MSIDAAKYFAEKSINPGNTESNMQLVAAQHWSGPGAVNDGAPALNPGRNADPAQCLNDGLSKDSMNSLYKSEDSFTEAQRELQDALIKLRSGDTTAGKQELTHSIQAINQGFGDIRDGLGAQDGDLSQLDQSNPLHRIGSGRQAIKSGRQDLNDVLAKLDGCNPDMAGAISELEGAAVKIGGGTGNVHKAVDLLDRGLPDHRPKHHDHSTTVVDPIEPAPNPVPAPHPDVLVVSHPKEYRDGQHHMDRATGSLTEAIQWLTQGDFNHAGREFKGALKDMAEARQDLKYAFGGKLPGSETFDQTQQDILNAVTEYKHGNYNQAISGIRTALGDIKENKDAIT